MAFGEIEDANTVWEILRDALDGTPQRVVAIGPRPVAGEPELRVTLPGGRELTLVPRVLDHLISEARAVKVRSTGRTPHEEDIWTQGYDDGFAAAMNPVQQQKLRDEGRQLAAHELRERLAAEAAEAFALVERLEETAEGDSKDDEVEAGQDCAEALERLLGQFGFYRGAPAGGDGP